MSHQPLLKLMIIVFIMLFGIGASTLLVFAQGPVDNTFTYQGRLIRAGQYYNGTCNFGFRLYDQTTGGSQVGTAQTVLGVAVQDGYFTTNLNSGNEFGAGAFTGNKRFLAVEVQCPGDAAFVSLNSQRVELKAAPYALYALTTTVITIPWSAVTSKPAGFADNTDDINTYTSGYGLTLQGSQFNVVTSTIVAAVPNTYQSRVSGTCSGTNAIRVVNANGTVSCDSSGTGATIVPGEGITLTGSVFSIDEVYVQRRVAVDCGPGQAIRAINPDGSPQCEPIPQGDVTEVVAGAGLSGGGTSGDVSLAVPNGGITSSMLADSAVTNVKLQAGIVNNARLATGAVDSAAIQNKTITFADMAGPCPDGQTIKWQAVNNSWGCAVDSVAAYIGGDGLDISSNLVSVNTGAGVKIDQNDQLALDFEFPGTGISPQAARSDHTHGSDYVSFSTTSASNDATGSYSGGFSVSKIHNQPVNSAAPNYGDILKYDGTQWTSAGYYFPLTLDVQYVSETYSEANGTHTVYCPTGFTVVGGGCECADDDLLEVSDSSGGWYCDCDNGSSDTNKAHAICLKSTYP